MSLVRSAVSDVVGVLNLHLSLTNMADHRIYLSEPGRASFETPVTTLTEYFSNLPLGPFLLKSDTQGSEPKILRGGWGILAQCVASSTLILEFWPHGMENAGEDIGAFIDELSLLPRQSFIIDNRIRKLCPIRWEALAERSRTDIAPETMGFVDLLLVPPDSRVRDTINEFIQESSVEMP